MEERWPDWLMEHGGASIQYRVARELLGETSPSRLRHLQDAMVATPGAQAWLAHLKATPPMRANDIHGSGDGQFENAMAKLLRLGFHAGIPVFDALVEPYLDHLTQESIHTPCRASFSAIVLSGLLVAAGYRTDPLLRHAHGSLGELTSFAALGLSSLYEENRTPYRGIPSVWSDRPLIRPSLIAQCGFCFPLVYDLFALSSLYGEDHQTDRQIVTILDSLLSNAFHTTVADGYGILAAGSGRYHAMGWDPKLPGYFDPSEAIEHSPNRLVLYAELLSPLPAATCTPWYGAVVAHLDSLRSEDGHVCFPATYLPEATGYAVMGCHMGLGENRRHRRWRELESTFVLCRLHSLSSALPKARSIS